MAQESHPTKTRLWWDDSEVEFIRWSDKSLVFSWGNTTDTAVHLSRGTVVRLLKNGVLRVEGELPDWACPVPNAAAPAEYHPAIHQPNRITSHFKPIVLDVPPEPDGVESPLPAVPPRDDGPTGRFRAITRLIRKLGGGRSV